MENWIKIQTFDRLHQAELRKTILEQNDIQAIVVNERDSLFLIGEIELYVKKEDEARAHAIIDEFNGLTKINSFVNPKPIQLMQAILSENNIDSYIKQKEDNRYILDNYELYVANETVEQVVPFLTGEKLSGWKKLTSCSRVSQTKFRVDMLEEDHIDCIIIKKKDSEYHVEQIDIYVKNTDFESATTILDKLNGWIMIKTFDHAEEMEMQEDLLKRQGIRSLMDKQGGKFALYVEAHNEELAIEQINAHRQWTKLRVYNSDIEANFYRDMLEENDLNAIVINERDSSFLLGTVALYVDKTDITEAEKIIQEAKQFND